ncbi:MAG: UDP-N-acetylmuramate--L-alanine ligase [Flavobacteriales bacterium]|nr:UDP-N-acetylmuramate--L-alanine ligase [Flavobacteriales bacterium]|tara:strand:- start:2490 stop:3830 length:1341 start_codon:yes stop_codon:yes gene_type:complete
MKKIHFLGIGGVGMSALARWSIHNGYIVSGYDREQSLITDDLVAQGAKIYYKSSYINYLESNNFADLIVYSSAFKNDHPILSFFINKNFNLNKRACFLAKIAEKYDVIAIAGTHGKTTISCILSHILKCSGIDCNAFIGGFSKNYNNNLLIGKSKFMIIEADEYDKSFLSLNPYLGLISSVDKDHGDTYKTYKEMLSAYSLFATKCKKNIINNNVINKLNFSENGNVKLYSLNQKSNGYRLCLNTNVRGSCSYKIYNDNNYLFSIDLLNVPKYNIENFLAAISISCELGVHPSHIIKAIKSFRGVKRRFEYHINNQKLKLIEDYAHHPVELNALLEGVRNLHPSKKITLIFQPHLFSRTKDFLKDFADVLSKVDNLILLEIYPARENPIEGFSIKNLFSIVQIKNKVILDKKDVYPYLVKLASELIVVAGAGDVNSIIPDLKRNLL